MNKTKYPSYPTISLIKIRNKTVFDRFTVTVLVLQCFLYMHARFQHDFLYDFNLLLYYKVIFLDFCLEYKRNDGMTFSPDFLFSVNLFRKWLRNLVKWNVNYIVRNINVLIHFSLYKFQKHNSTIQRQDTIQHNENTTYQKK
jgi:hypothetical protein